MRSSILAGLYLANVVFATANGAPEHAILTEDCQPHALVQSFNTLEARQDFPRPFSSPGDNGHEPHNTTDAQGATTTTGKATTTAIITKHSDINKVSIAPTLTSTQSGLEHPVPTSVMFKNATNTTTTDGLPINPVITPAIGVGGVLLIGFGLLYAMIGIRNILIQVFLSSGLSSSLGVTVLIIYVMSPPISDAIQGAYLVAIFLTGLVFGALSLISKELMEGLGCALGGFCLSMWILCLKSGGLLVTTSIKSAFIGTLIVASYALSFSRFTRPYALILTTAFSGATASVLGVDCFSRLGLKEFWLYIWDLNQNIFPLETVTYPVTRNISVELAAIMVVFALGVVSQFRSWRLIQNRLQQEALAQNEEDKRTEDLETEAARRLGESHMKERQAWEAMYGAPEAGDESNTQAGITTGLRVNGRSSIRHLRNRSVDVTDAIELTMVTQTGRGSEKDGYKGDDAEDRSRTAADTEDTTPSVLDINSQPRNQGSADAAAAVGLISRKSTRSRNFSRRSLLRRFSIKGHEALDSPSQEALVKPAEPVNNSLSSLVSSVDDADVPGTGCPSTISDCDDGTQYGKGATADGRTVMGVIPHIHDGQSSNQQPRMEEQRREAAGSQLDRAFPGDTNCGNPTHTIDENDMEASVSEPKEKGSKGNRLPPETDRWSFEPDMVKILTKSEHDYATGPPPGRESQASLNVETVKQLSRQTSRVQLDERTSEWAQHLTQADALEPDAMVPGDDDVDATEAYKREIAAPVNVHELLQTPIDSNSYASSGTSRNRRTAAKAHSGSMTHTSRSSRSSPTRQSPTRLHAGARPSRLPTGVDQIHQRASLTTLRSVSSPMLVDVTTSPQRANAAAGKLRRDQSPAPLLAQREDMVRNRPFYVSYRSTQDRSASPSRNSRNFHPTTIPQPVNTNFGNNNNSNNNNNNNNSPPRSRYQHQRRSSSRSSNMSNFTLPQSRSGRLISATATATASQTPTPEAQARMAAWRDTVRDDAQPKRDPFANRFYLQHSKSLASVVEQDGEEQEKTLQQQQHRHGTRRAHAHGDGRVR